MNKVLLAGATGYLGGFVARELTRRGVSCRAVVRNPDKLEKAGIQCPDVARAEVTDPASLEGVCDGIDVVISTVGITRQKDGLSYMDVDYQANVNLLNEALRSGVRKFVYVSVLRGEELRHLEICAAKERFVDVLRDSGMDYCIVRPNGFFADMAEFLAMARRGRVYLLGTRTLRSNPIDGADLAHLCVDAMEDSREVIDAGGPEVLTHEEIARAAFAATGRPARITRLPMPLITVFLGVLRLLTPSRIYGPIEFFLTVLAMDMVAPRYGTRTLSAFFQERSRSAGPVPGAG